MASPATGGAQAGPVWVTGGGGLLGRALLPLLPGAHAPTRTALDLTCPAATARYVAAVRPQVVVHLAARVGGILAQAARPADFALDNLLIDVAVLRALRAHPPRHLIVILSTCMYPELPDAAYPLTEAQLDAGPVPAGHAGYAQAKRALLTGCQALAAQAGVGFTALVAANLYGPGDAVHVADAPAAHFVATALGRLARAAAAGQREVVFLGRGHARRQVLFAPDLARLVAHLASGPPQQCALNVAPAAQHTVATLAAAVAVAVGYRGTITFAGTGPEGPARKDVCSAALLRRVPAFAGWQTPLAEGLAQTARWLRAQPEGRAPRVGAA